MNEESTNEGNLLKDVLLSVSESISCVQCLYQLTFCTLGTPSKKKRAKTPAIAPKPPARPPLSRWLAGPSRGRSGGLGIVLSHEAGRIKADDVERDLVPVKMIRQYSPWSSARDRMRTVGHKGSCRPTSFVVGAMGGLRQASGQCSAHVRVSPLEFRDSYSPY